LIGNALKFTFRGKISLLANLGQSRKDGGGQTMLQLIVRDTGIGVKQEDREKIFEMLGTLEATATMNT